MSAVRCVAEVGAELGEGPVWDAGRACLWFVDIKAPALHRFYPDSGRVDTIVAPLPIGWALPTDAGSLLCRLKDGLHLFDPDTGRFSRHLVVPGEPEGNRLNDACVAPDGSVWFGSMDDAERGPHGRFHRLANGVIRPVGPADICITNGPAIVPAGDRVFYTDTLGRVIHSAAIRPDGTVGPERDFARIEDGAGYPDGPTVDGAGRLWTGLFGGWAVRCYDDDGLAATVRLPVANVTKLAFGGRDRRTAYVTTAWKGLTPAVRTEQPLAGHLFAFQVDEPGPPTSLVRL